MKQRVQPNVTGLRQVDPLPNGRRVFVLDGERPMRQMLADADARRVRILSLRHLACRVAPDVPRSDVGKLPVVVNPLLGFGPIGADLSDKILFEFAEGRRLVLPVPPRFVGASSACLSVAQNPGEKPSFSIEPDGRDLVVNAEQGKVILCQGVPRSEGWFTVSNRGLLAKPSKLENPSAVLSSGVPDAGFVGFAVFGLGRDDHSRTLDFSPLPSVNAFVEAGRVAASAVVAGVVDVFQLAAGALRR